MRAYFQKDLVVQEEYLIKGESAHHLVSVVRVAVGEQILLLNGKGLTITAVVSSISHKELFLKKITSTELKRSYSMDLALGIPKKEALELSLKQAVELGFRKIYLIRSKYSQIRIPEESRLESLLVSAVEQSNSAFMPEVIFTEWDKIPSTNYGQILVMDSQSKANKIEIALKSDARLLIVGPEAGFSNDELALLHNLPRVSILNLPTPILRTPTAVATGAGIILKSLLD
jgi:16S rRNA (uracil1498-N3)-methyltransferase